MAKVLKRLRELLVPTKSRGSMAVGMKVTHADGTVTDYGVVSETPLEWKTEGR